MKLKKQISSQSYYETEEVFLKLSLYESKIYRINGTRMIGIQMKGQIFNQKWINPIELKDNLGILDNFLNRQKIIID